MVMNRLRSATPQQMLSIFSLLVILPLMVTACEKGEKQKNISDISLNSHDLAVYLTRLTPEGWELYDKVGLFTSANLYERINGRAELYLAYDVISMTTATFERQGSLEDFIEISIYDMGTPTNAFGVFSVERLPGETPLDMGRLSYSSDANCYIWKGTHYIVVVASDTTEEFQRLALQLARKVTAQLPDSTESVWGLTAFPPDNLIPDSIQYFKVDAMGLDFMQDTFIAKYQLAESEITVFLSQKESPVAALNTVEQYKRYCEKYGKGNKIVEKHGLDLWLCDMGGAFDVIFNKKRLVCGVLAAPDPDEAVTSAVEIIKKLQF